MRIVDLVNSAIESGIARKSKLSPDALMVPGFTSIANRHIFNNLGAISSRYLEVGVHKGGSFVSVGFGNKLDAYAVDDWSEFNEDGSTYKEFLEHGNKFVPGFHCITKDFFSIPESELPKGVDLYFYDGNHSFEAQCRAIERAPEFLAREAVIVVDDYSWKWVKDGTQEGLKNSGLNLIYEAELPTHKPSDNEGYWNGIYIAIVQNQKEKA